MSGVIHARFRFFKSKRASVCFLLLDDLPDLQEAQEEAEPTGPPVYQVDVGVSHQERRAHTQPPDTHWLTQLAHIATGPQSPLLQESPHSRSVLLLKTKTRILWMKSMNITYYMWL